MYQHTMIRNALVALSLAALAATGCVEDPDAQYAHLSLSVQGLETDSTVEIEVPSGLYTIEADGQADDQNADVDVRVVDANGDVVARAQLTVPNADAGSSDGDIGHGSVEVEAEAGGVTEVTIPFAWDGARPDSGWNIDIEFGHAPDIDYWTVTPAPIMATGQPFNMIVGATNYTGLNESLIVTGLLDDIEIPLQWDPVDGIFRGGALAPPTQDSYILTVTVEDEEGQFSQSDKALFIGDGEAANALLNAAADSAAAVVTPLAGGNTRVRLTVTTGGVPVAGAEVLVWEDGNPNNRQKGTTDAAGQSTVIINGNPDKIRYSIQWQDATGQWHVIQGSK